LAAHGGGALAVKVLPLWLVAAAAATVLNNLLPMYELSGGCH
jgi:hypothetical protein